MATEVAKKVDEGPEHHVLYHEEALPWWLPVLIVALPIIPFFRKYHVTVTETTLEFGYSLSWTAKKVDRRQIENVELIVDPPISGLWQWGGYGIRGIWREIGYIYKDGPGLRIKIRNENGSESHYTFNTDQPERVKAILDGQNSKSEN